MCHSNSYSQNSTRSISPDIWLQVPDKLRAEKNYETWWLERGVAVTRLSKSTKLLYNGPEFPGPCRNNNPIAQKSEMVQYTTSQSNETILMEQYANDRGMVEGSGGQSPPEAETLLDF